MSSNSSKSSSSSKNSSSSKSSSSSNNSKSSKLSKSSDHYLKMLGRKTSSYDWKKNKKSILGNKRFYSNTQLKTADLKKKLDKLEKKIKKQPRGEKGKKKRNKLKKEIEKLHSEKCRTRKYIEAGFRLNPKTKKCVLCPPPKKHFKTVKRKDGKTSMQCVTRDKYKGIKGLGKAISEKSGRILNPDTNRLIGPKNALFEKLNRKTVNQRKNLFLRRKYLQSIGKMPKNVRKNKKKSVKSSHSASSIKSHSKMNSYRTKLNALYKQKKTQRKKNSELTCRIKKWRISENPNLGKKNKEKLTKLTQKACQLQKKYLNVLSRIDINENRALAEMKKIKKK